MFKRLFSRFFQSKEPDPLKYLIVGLGNMGQDYDNTRHNIGFDIIDYLAEQFDVTLKDDRYGFIGHFKHKGRTFYILKPSTYVNRSGQAVVYWMQKHKIKPENLLILIDDLNLEFGKLRLRGKGSDGGHNGLKDITQRLQTGRYARLRFGIGRNYGKGRQVDYVLGVWDAEEQDQLAKLIKKSAEAVKSFGTIGLDFTMNKFNN